MRRVVFILSVLVLIVAVLYYWPASPEPGRKTRTSVVVPEAPSGNPATQSVATSDRPTTAPRDSAPARATPATDVAVVPAMNPETDFPIVAPLNSPGAAVQRDLDVVSQLFDAWQSNFPREGNPVGENAEITAALMGENRLGLALIPKGHRAVNEQGELCDRWGTPFRFHQISGTHMEVRSAGPDRRFATEDDAVWTPQ